MEKINLRIISKAGFLLAFFGFFMPFALNQNGFQVAGYLSQFFGSNAVTNSLYALFFFSCIGGVLFLLLLMKKNFSIILDWIVISAAVIAMIVIFSEVSKVLDSISNVGGLFGVSGAGRVVGNAVSEYFEIGAYVVIIGVYFALILQIFSLLYMNNENVIGIQPLQIEPGSKYIVKNPASISIQKGSGKSYENIGMLSHNDIVTLDKTEKDYSFITTKDGKKGWCRTSCLGKC